jgi:hypothetical protein
MRGCDKTATKDFGMKSVTGVRKNDELTKDMQF